MSRKIPPHAQEILDLDFDAIKRRHPNWRSIYSNPDEAGKERAFRKSIHKARADLACATADQRRESLTWLALNGSGPLWHKEKLN